MWTQSQVWQATPAAIHPHPLAPGREYENLKHFKYVIEKREHITEKEMEKQIARE